MLRLPPEPPISEETYQAANDFRTSPNCGFSLAIREVIVAVYYSTYPLSSVTSFQSVDVKNMLADEVVWLKLQPLFLRYFRTRADTPFRNYRDQHFRVKSLWLFSWHIPLIWEYEHCPSIIIIPTLSEPVDGDRTEIPVRLLQHGEEEEQHTTLTLITNQTKKYLFWKVNSDYVMFSRNYNTLDRLYEAYLVWEHILPRDVIRVILTWCCVFRG